MKKLILLFSALTFALVGCDSAPSNSDLEGYMKPKFDGCQNLKVVDIKKTNGYQEDGYYRVEFSYGLELKDPSLLDTLRTQWIEEKEEAKKQKEASEQFYATRDSLEKDIEKTAKEFGLNARYISSSDEIIVHNQDLDGGTSYEIPTPIQEKIRSWNNLVKSRDQVIDSQKSYKIFGNEDTVVYRNYYNGCKPSVKQFTKNLFDGQRSALMQSDDKLKYFDEYKVKVSLTLPMRKTENGWQVINDN